MTTSNTETLHLRFYNATMTKRICLDSGFVEPGSPMFVAKWQGLYVIAKDNDNFFFIDEARASHYVRTERNDKNKLVRALNGPTIEPVGDRFQWTVECGRSCPDGCDETLVVTEKVASKDAALALMAQLDGTRARTNRDFLRIRGPAFYQIKRPTPRPVATPPAPTRRPTPQNGVRRGADMTSYTNMPQSYNWSSEPYDDYYDNLMLMEEPSRRHLGSSPVEMQITDELVRRIRYYEQIRSTRSGNLAIDLRAAAAAAFTTPEQVRAAHEPDDVITRLRQAVARVDRQYLVNTAAGPETSTLPSATNPTDTAV